MRTTNCWVSSHYWKFLFNDVIHFTKIFFIRLFVVKISITLWMNARIFLFFCFSHRCFIISFYWWCTGHNFCLLFVDWTTTNFKESILDVRIDSPSVLFPFAELQINTTNMYAFSFACMLIFFQNFLPACNIWKRRNH